MARFAGGVVVRRDGANVRYLLVTARNDTNRWVVPKGQVEDKESPAEAAVREVEEEAGVVARVRGRLGRVPFLVRGVERPVEFFLLDYVGRATSSESRHVEWYSYDRARGLVSHAHARHVLQLARRAVERARPA